MSISNNIKRIAYLLTLSAIWILSVSLIITKKESSQVIINDVPVVTPLLITNEMSEIKGVKKFDREVEKVMRRWNVKGVSVALMKHNKLIYAKGYGYADFEKEIECEPYNLFRIASLSKLITAVAIMKLIDDGYLSLTSKVFGKDGILKDEYNEYRDKRVEDIAIHHLLRHEGGFTVPIGDPMFKLELVEKGLNINRPITSENTIEYSITRRLGFSPGSSKKYSNVGFLILSEVIEKISGKSYERYVKDNVLIPAKCYNTHLAHNLYEDRYPNEVRYYSDTKGDFIEAYDGSDVIEPKAYGGNDIRALKGGGAWVSTTTDMLRLTMAIDGKNGKNDVKDIISVRSVYNIQNDIENKLPIGWASVADDVFERTGSFSGSAAIMRFHADGYSWIILSNTSSWIGYRLNTRFKTMMRSAIRKLPKMPLGRDLLDEEYVKSLNNIQGKVADTK